MFENQTEEVEEEVIFERDNKEYWCTPQEGKKSLQWEPISIARASNNSCCFLICFAMVQVLLKPWSLFIESLGSYSRCRVSNRFMPCVLGPTSFNLQFWANILISDEHQNVVVFMMIFIWAWWSSSGFIIMNEHMNFWAITKVWAFPHTLESYFPRFALGLVQER